MVQPLYFSLICMWLTLKKLMYLPLKPLIYNTNPRTVNLNFYTPLSAAV